MWIFLLLVVAFVVWHFIPKRDPNQPAPRFRKETRAVETDPGWATFIEEHCESPAETAFLQAMIKSCDLRPNDGSLYGSGLRLDFQVEEGRYRVDFLANKWLVVEIDGAAWHSSPEAIERDKLRDQYFEDRGYSVLRIPAKVVFNAPEEAVQRVRSALRQGKRTMPVPVQKSGWQRLSDTASAMSQGLQTINDFVSRAQAVERAVKDAKLAAHQEQSAIAAAISMAQSELTTADWLNDSDEETRKLFEESYLRLMGAVADRRNEQQERDDEKLEVRSFPKAPPKHDNLAYHAAIQDAYVRIVEERDEFLSAQRLIVRSDLRMPSLVEKKLNELGCGEYWALLDGIDANYPISTR
ncbi:endonuclease domain-containing protein [Sphingomonas sp. QA11]|uniref:endonuclease domain-containing protein n=1 Tax=Sphingomonas sp. QA11 TaxID=2950605 RepID=UPI00234AB20C|nr:DUF559 domain-containing protein [Sphingomonas sp. QA11]WCM29192.1 endonuclease domain-containing protein [Sphingomonas sp. QA11]